MYKFITLWLLQCEFGILWRLIDAAFTKTGVLEIRQELAFNIYLFFSAIKRPNLVYNLYNKHDPNAGLVHCSAPCRDSLKGLDVRFTCSDLKANRDKLAICRVIKVVLPSKVTVHANNYALIFVVLMLPHSFYKYLLFMLISLKYG